MRDQPEVVKAPATYLDTAAEWVGQRGGSAQCARDLLKMTAGHSDARSIKAALKKVGAPMGTLALIGAELYSEAKRHGHGLE